MNDTTKKILHSIVAVLAMIGIGTATYLMSRNNSALLSASILDGLAPSQICSVEFVTPKGTAYPQNGVVTIQSVNVTVDTGPAISLPYCDGLGDVISSGNVSGSDLEGSPITFADGGTACPAGTVYSNNSIVMPSTFSGSCSVQAEVSGVLVSPVDLTIQAVSCATLQTSILRGYGTGFENYDLSVVTLPKASNTETTDPFDFTTPPSTIDLNYPTTTVEDAMTFQIHLTFVPDITSDPVNGINERAAIILDNGNRVYQIKVKNEGAGNEVLTALNFAYVFNDLLGTNSPFVAYTDPADDLIIQLSTRELGIHTNTAAPGYVCLVDGAAQAGCFSGGTAGDDGGGNPFEVLTTPLTLDKELLQGESSLVFANNSAGEIKWISSHPAILEAASLSEVDQQDQGTADFVDTTIGVVGTATPANGSYNIGECQRQFDSNNNYIAGSETCPVTATVPVEFDISTKSYTVNVAIGDEVVPVTVKGDKLIGMLTGTGTYTQSAGISMAMTGTVTGVVSGSVTGTYSGTVTGSITATVQATGSMTGAANWVVIADFTTNIPFSVVAITPGTLTDVPTFTTTVKKQEDDISHVGILFAKRPGTSILSAIDKQGCIASFEVEVIKKQVILQMVGRNPGDVLDVSDTVQINAYAGGANAELEEYENITAASGIEWFSSNEEVATIDGTGLLTALKPGVTNITARYDTGDAEIGAIESVPMSITVNKISGLRVTFDPPTEDKLPAEVVKNAHKSVIIAVHNPEAAGQTIMVEGQSVSIELPPGTYSNEIERVAAIALDLNTKITALDNAPVTLPAVPQPIVQVTTVEGYPGMLVLQPINQDGDYDTNKVEDIDENGVIDLDTTALESDLSIIPTYTSVIPLPASETYGLRVIAKYDNGATKLLPPTQFRWVNTPSNYLEQASLDTGLIKLGQISGTSTVVAEYVNADASVVRSNYLTITVDSGPVIEYVRRIGSGSITKGSRITLQTKITDINTIADISDISTSLVYSTYSNYQQINEDDSAIWFSATPYLSEVTVADQSTPQTTTTTEGETGTEGTTGTPTPAPVSPKFKTYNIPIEIPVDANLFDGFYKLILTITDAENHTLNYVYPMRIGEIGKGDVNGDGTTNMVDVIIAFQIATGLIPNPTPAQLQAANVDGIGGVNLVDVILLFNKVSNNQ